MRPSLLDLVLPDTCHLCHANVVRPSRHLCCPFCWKSLPRIENPCRHCAKEVSRNRICGACLTRPLSTGIAVVPFVYGEGALHLIRTLKFQNDLRSARTLAYGMTERIRTQYQNQSMPEAIVPTPLSLRRHIVRGYNQTVRLADEISRSLKIPVQERLSRRDGPTQHGRSRTARQAMPLTAFKYKGSAPSHIALLDDVITTGTTMRIMARVCQLAGVRRVDLWAACRADKPPSA